MVIHRSVKIYQKFFFLHYETKSGSVLRHCSHLQIKYCFRILNAMKAASRNDRPARHVALFNMVILLPLGTLKRGINWSLDPAGVLSSCLPSLILRGQLVRRWGLRPSRPHPAEINGRVGDGTGRWSVFTRWRCYAFTPPPPRSHLFKMWPYVRIWPPVQGSASRRYFLRELRDPLFAPYVAVR